MIEHVVPLGNGVVHPSGRPMEVVRDDSGDRWLRDKSVDHRRDLRQQGCWRCGEQAFTRNDWWCDE